MSVKNARLSKGFRTSIVHCLFLIIIFFVHGCRKNSVDTYTISVVVIDWDTQTTIPHSTALFHQGGNSYGFDSVLTDANGKAVLTVEKNGNHRIVSAVKDGYVYADVRNTIPLMDFSDRTDTVYLAKGSYINIGVYKTGPWLPIANVEYTLSKYYGINNPDPLKIVTGDFFTAKEPDYIVKSGFFYTAPPGDKVYIDVKVMQMFQAASSISKDSVSLIQYGTVNYNIYY